MLAGKQGTKQRDNHAADAGRQQTSRQASAWGEA
jgi:hypothetical protein